jgi:hypothetical protein
MDFILNTMDCRPDMHDAVNWAGEITDYLLENCHHPMQAQRS